MTAMLLAPERYGHVFNHPEYWKVSPASIQTKLPSLQLTVEAHGKHYITTDLLSLFDKVRLRFQPNLF
jgi:hypothetical protein